MTIQEFITERAKGAAKIAADAKAKGGLSLLTAIHFEAKAPSYAAAMALVSEDSPPANILSHLKRLERIAATTVMSASSMLVFQQQTGKQEAYGEVICFLEFGGPGVSVEAGGPGSGRKPGNGLAETMYGTMPYTSVLDKHGFQPGLQTDNESMGGQPHYEQKFVHPEGHEVNVVWRPGSIKGIEKRWTFIDKYGDTKLGISGKQLDRHLATHIEARAHRPDEVVKTFEITAPKDVMERFEKFLSHVQHCAGVGHSTNVGMSIDGDGPDYFYVEPEPPEIDHELSDKEQRVEIP